MNPRDCHIRRLEKAASGSSGNITPYKPGRNKIRMVSKYVHAESLDT